MKHLTLALLLGATLSAQSADTVESHVAAAQGSERRESDCSHQSLQAGAGLARHASPRRGGQPGAAHNAGRHLPIDRAGRASR